MKTGVMWLWLASTAVAWGQDMEVFFEANSSGLTSSMEHSLTAFLEEKAPDHFGQVLEILGYADAAGPNGYNDSISRVRCLTVYEYLRNAGLTHRVQLGARGEADLKYSGSEMSKNRRVSLTWQEPNHQDLVEAFTPPAEVFTVRPGRDTLIQGAQGTQLRITPGSFLTDSEASIEVSLVECYEMADMIMAQLTTVGKDGRLLTSKGMVKVTATQGGEPVELTEEGIGLSFPTRTEGDGTDLYYAIGEGTDMRWELAEDAEFELPEASPSQSTDFARQLPQSQDGTVAIQIDGIPLATWGTDSEGNPTLNRTFSPGEALDVEYSEVGDSLVPKFAANGNRSRFPTSQFQSVQAQYYELTTVRGGQSEELDANLSFRVRKLGWINCDYFFRVNQDNPFVTLKVWVNVREMANLVLIPEGLNGLMPYQTKVGDWYEWRVPDGTRFTIVGFVPSENSDKYWFVQRRIVAREGSLRLTMQRGSKDQILKALVGIDF